MSQNTAVPTDTTYMRFFRLDNHDAQCLQIGDCIARKGRLATVVDVKRKRAGEMVVEFDDKTDMIVSHQYEMVGGHVIDIRPEWMNNMTIYRPRRMFVAAPIRTSKKKDSDQGTLKKDTTKKSRSDRRKSGSRK